MTTSHYSPIVAGPRGALVVGGSVGSLAVIRSLGRCGMPVVFLAGDHPIAKSSRYVTRSLDWAGPRQPNAVASLIGLARRYDLQGYLLFAGGDLEARLIAQHHQALSELFHMTTSDWSITQVADDKHLTYAHAASLGIATPQCYELTGADDVAALDCRFPVILKPSVHESRNAFTLAKAWRADDRDALLALYRKAAALVGEQAIIVQELVPGDGRMQFSYAGLWRDGKPVGSLAARRRRQYPVDFGYTSTFVETVDNEEVEDAACRFLGSLNYSGLAELEFKFDGRDRRYKLLDVNPRIWTWIGLGAAAGVDFPLLAFRLAHGEAVDPVRARVGVGWRYASRDLVALGQEIVSRRWPDWRLRQPTTYALFAADDPVPALLELPLTLTRALTTRLPGLLARSLAR